MSDFNVGFVIFPGITQLDSNSPTIWRRSIALATTARPSSVPYNTVEVEALEDLTGRTEALETSTASLTDTVSTLEATVGGLGTDVGALQSTQGDLVDSVGTLKTAGTDVPANAADIAVLHGKTRVRPNVVLRNYVTSEPWLASTSAADNAWRSIVWSPELGIFCAAANTGTGDRIMTSPDGITWTSRTAPENDHLALSWSPELRLFAAVSISGTDDRVITSPDGITWSSRTSVADNNWRDKKESSAWDARSSSG